MIKCPIDSLSRCPRNRPVNGMSVRNHWRVLKELVNIVTFSNEFLDFIEVNYSIERQSSEYMIWDLMQKPYALIIFEEFYDGVYGGLLCLDEFVKG
jgi:hypothetical protein